MQPVATSGLRPSASRGCRHHDPTGGEAQLLRLAVPHHVTPRGTTETAKGGVPVGSQTRAMRCGSGWALSVSAVACTCCQPRGPPSPTWPQQRARSVTHGLVSHPTACHERGSLLPQHVQKCTGSLPGGWFGLPLAPLVLGADRSRAPCARQPVCMWAWCNRPIYPYSASNRTRSQGGYSKHPRHPPRQLMMAAWRTAEGGELYLWGLPHQSAERAERGGHQHRSALSQFSGLAVVANGANVQPGSGTVLAVPDATVCGR